MQNQDDITERKALAEQFISKAEDFIQQGKLKAGLKSYQRATNIYFNMGSYIKLSEIFIRVSTLLNRETMIYETMEYLRKTRVKLRDLDLPEEEAKIMMVMGNLSYRIGDYASASEYYEECSELYLKAEPEDYREASAMFLLRAAECYEHLKKHEIGERIVIQALLRLNPKSTSVDYQIEEYKGLKLIKLKNFKDAIPIYKNLFEFFSEAVDILSSVIENSDLKEIAIYAKSRIIHIISEYRMILMFCYKFIGNEDKVNEMAEETINQLFSSIQMLKGMILKGNWTRDDLKRLTFDGFMAGYFQKYSGIKGSMDDKIENIITDGITGEALEILKKLPYYDLILKVESYDIDELEEELLNFNLGRLEKYKKILIAKKQ